MMYPQRGPAKNVTGTYFELTNEEDTYLYMLDIFDNGSTTIDVRAKQREPISYSGEMVIDY